MKIQRILRLAGFLPLVLGLLAAPAAAFQEAGGHEKTKSWLELFETTGPVGYLMALVSVIGTTLVIEHMVSLRREKLAPDVLAGDLEALINEEEYERALGGAARCFELLSEIEPNPERKKLLRERHRERIEQLQRDFPNSIFLKKQ